jgi:hypothetical protein
VVKFAGWREVQEELNWAKKEAGEGIGREGEGERVGVGVGDGVTEELGLRMEQISRRRWLEVISHCSLGYAIITCCPFSDIFLIVKKQML